MLLRSAVCRTVASGGSSLTGPWSAWGTACTAKPTRRSRTSTEIALRASDATLRLTTSLSHHGLTDVIPPEIDVALPRSRPPPSVRAPVRWHRFHEDTFDLGRETLEVDEGLTIGIYSAERSLIDAFRLRHQRAMRWPSRH
jgi:hypothetical protein